MTAERAKVLAVNKCLPYRREKSSRMASPTCWSGTGERLIQADIASLAGPEAFLSKNVKNAYMTAAYTNGVVKPKSFSASVSHGDMHSPPWANTTCARPGCHRY